GDRPHGARRVAPRVLAFDDEGPEARGLQASLVAPRRREPERHLAHLLLSLRLTATPPTTDEQARLVVVVEPLVLRQTVHHGDDVPVLHTHIHRQLSATLVAHVLPHQLRPELPERRPAQPLDGPVVLDVAGPGQAPTEPHSPAGE